MMMIMILISLPAKRRKVIRLDEWLGLGVSVAVWRWRTVCGGGRQEMERVAPLPQFNLDDSQAFIILIPMMCLSITPCI